MRGQTRQEQCTAGLGDGPADGEERGRNMHSEYCEMDTKHSEMDSVIRTAWEPMKGDMRRVWSRW